MPRQAPNGFQQLGDDGTDSESWPQKMQLMELMDERESVGLRLGHAVGAPVGARAGERLGPAVGAPERPAVGGEDGLPAGAAPAAAVRCTGGDLRARCPPPTAGSATSSGGGGGGLGQRLAQPRPNLGVGDGQGESTCTRPGSGGASCSEAVGEHLSHLGRFRWAGWSLDDRLERERRGLASRRGQYLL